MGRAACFVYRPANCRLRKTSGLGVVILDGKDHYLGRHGTPKSVETYHRLICQGLANGRHLLPSAEDVTVVELIMAFARLANLTMSRGRHPWASCRPRPAHPVLTGLCLRRDLAGVGSRQQDRDPFP